MLRAANAILLACSIALGATPEPECSCANSNPVVGPAFTVRGRLSCWNGAPTLRIWIVGTNRILGVRGTSKVPDNVEPGNFDTEVWGDFVVYPLTKERPGVMQFVCIETGSNLVRKTRSSKPSTPSSK